MKLTRILMMAVAAAALSVFAIPADAQIAGTQRRRHQLGNWNGMAIGTAATGMAETGTVAIG